MLRLGRARSMDIRAWDEQGRILIQQIPRPRGDVEHPGPLRPDLRRHVDDAEGSELVDRAVVYREISRAILVQDKRASTERSRSVRW